MIRFVIRIVLAVATRSVSSNIEIRKSASYRYGSLDLTPTSESVNIVKSVRSRKS